MKLAQVDLQEVSSLKIGPKVKYLEIRNVREIKEAIQYAKKNKLKIHVLGECTNSYFSNNLKGFLFIKLQSKNLEFIRNDASVVVSVGASLNWHYLVMQTVQRKLWGIENLSYIPGSVGAAPVQNIGAYGVELKDVFLSAQVYDLKLNKLKILKNNDCKFGYRDSIFKRQKGRFVILSIQLQLSEKPKPILTYKPMDSLVGMRPSIQEVSNLIIKTRKEKLPDYNLYPNCGSFFKNPTINKSTFLKLQKNHPHIPYFKCGNKFKIPCAWLIENVAKMKGVKAGNLGTWPNQPLVIVNYGTASANELNKFVREIKIRIEKGAGIKIEQEVNYIKWP